MGSVQSLFIYPTKSCAAVPLESSKLTEEGLLGDRRIMLTGPDGTFLSQRSHPLLAHISLTYQDQQLILNFKGHTERFHHHSNSPCTVKIWQDTASATYLGDDISHHLSQILETEVHVVKVSQNTQRWVDSRYCQDKVSYGFADGFPFLITNTESLADFNQRLVQEGHHKITMSRFRPNIVVDGLDPFQEDRIQRLKIGEAIFRFQKPCSRCRIIGINPETLEYEGTPLKVLAAYRYKQEVKGACFGQNATLESPVTSEIRVGDPIEILA